MRTILFLTALTVAAAPLSAQRRNERHGFWINVGIGPGSTGTMCTTCNQNRVNGGSGEVRLGGTLSSHFLLGFDLTGWAITLNEVDQGIGAGTVALLWYPSRRGAFFLKGGVGGMRYTYTNPHPLVGGPVEIIDDAGVAILGAGYEFRLARNMSLAPFINIFSSGDVKRTNNGALVTPASPERRDFAQVGLGLTFH